MSDQIKKELLEAFSEIQGPRTFYQLDKIVVGAKFTPEHQYLQATLELQISYDNLRLAKFKQRQKAAKIDDLRAQISELEVEQEQTERAMLGAQREFASLLAIWERYPTKFTRSQIEEAAPREYQKRFASQSMQDLASHGTISVGNQDALRMAGMTITVKDGNATIEKSAEQSHNHVGLLK